MIKTLSCSGPQYTILRESISQELTQEEKRAAHLETAEHYKGVKPIETHHYYFESSEYDEAAKIVDGIFGLFASGGHPGWL